jgi:phosphate transport system permease protein
VLDRLTGNFTALPMLVFNFTRQPGDALKTEGAAGAIVVLLLVVLFVNAAGIFLRNSFEKKRS